MPHSPRLRGEDLWMLQAGTGEFGRVDRDTGMFEPVCFLPGFARGLFLTETHAVIGLSRPRESRTFKGLKINDRLDREGISPRCGVAVVNLRTGDLEHSLDIEGVVEEIYDVVLLHGTQRPMALGFRNDDVRYFVKPEGV